LDLFENYKRGGGRGSCNQFEKMACDIDRLREKNVEVLERRGGLPPSRIIGEGRKQSWREILFRRAKGREGGTW